MEVDTKGRRWRVTYTKHLKQKRKVYHDGFLEFSASGDKVRLYDESENLIESKFVGKSDSVECGKSFTMDSYLVDIADAVNLSSNTTVTPFAQKIGNKRNFFHRKPLHKVSNMVESNTNGKKAEPCTTGAPSSNSSFPHLLLEEWNVLYTTQLNKKAKTYHDGILQISQATGSLTKQITLASEDGQILGSRHMKSFECIESSAECELPGYMVQVYDLRICQEGSNQRSPLKQFVKSKTLMKSTSTNGVDYGLKKEQVKSTSTQTGNSTEMKKLMKSIPTNGVDYGTNKEQVKSMGTQTGNSTEMKKSTNTKDCVTVARRYDGLDYRTKEEQVKSMNTQTGNSTEMNKSTNTKECIIVARRDARQIMSVLKKPTAVPEREAAQLVKKAHLSSHLIQIDVSTGEEKLLSPQGLYDKDGNANHHSLTSPPMESGTQASEMQMRVKKNCTSSSMHNSSSVPGDINISASYEGRCEGINLDLEKADGTAGTADILFADADNFDFPSFDLGF